MTVTVKIFTKQGGRPTLFQTRDFDAPPVTIGRDAACTVALEDPLKHISRVHVELKEEEGVYWVSVVSKVNPVMVKGRRYGPGTRLTLNSGDSFEMGEFEVHVTFPEKPPARPAPATKSLVKALAEEDQAATREMPPPEPGIFDEPTYVGGEAEPTYMGPAAKAASAPAPAAPASASMNDALRVFLEGAGMPHQQISAAQSERLLRDGGAILRAAVEGLMMLLIVRGEVRKEFETEEPATAARDNNPLRVMTGPNKAMQFLFDPGDRTDGFLDPLQAIGDACEDLRAHELALMAGMRAAILGALRHFDPQALEKASDKSAGFSFGGKKAKLWDAFVVHQQRLTREAQEDFNKLFGRDFLTGYQAQLRKLKTGR